MFFNKTDFSRRGFFLSLAGISGLTAMTRWVNAQSARLDINRTGIVKTVNPTNFVWELEQSIDLKSWTTAPTNTVVVSDKQTFFRLKLVTATVRIAATSFQVPIGQTLFEAMKSVPSFSFNSQLYNGLGQFITGINGKQKGGGSNWFLYVNGQSATVGSSQYILKKGDVIEWRFI